MRIQGTIAYRQRERIGRWLFLGLVIAAISMIPEAVAAKDTEKGDPLGVAAEVLPPRVESGWTKDLDAATKQARNNRKPILICVMATWCPACRMLERTFGEPAVKESLARWICVEIDAERDQDIATKLGVTGIPALRLQTPSGRPAASHDGYLAPKDLIGWLDEHYDEARAVLDDALMETGQPLGFDVVKLIALFDRRDPAVREAALRRLLPHTEVARAPVVEAVRDGNLATRLTALELLAAWKAPIAGLDPWDPESMTETRLETLDRWVADAPVPETDDLLKASEEELAAAAADIDRMLGATDAEAEAIGERLARYGEQLLPVVQERRKTAVGDHEQMLLRALRYRLVASNALAMSWPGGPWRLASTESEQRRKAAEELAKRATSRDQAILLELFSDTDPLVREISLRGLQNIGGAKSVAALTKLLSDPEPNVRAAVLKQLEENPRKSMLPAVLAYLEKETDADLLVHGIRFLRAVEDEKAVRGIMTMLTHESWQVRAEAAEGLSQSEALTEYYGPNDASKQGLKADLSVALLRLLEDPEPFVVAKALDGLEGVDMEVAVDHLVAAVENHASLAGKILAILAQGQQMRPKALPHLVAFCKHEQPSIRAAAITELAMSDVATADRQLLVGLKDPDATVRTAAANALFHMFDQIREAKIQALERQHMTDPFGHVSNSGYAETASPGLLDSMIEKLKGAFEKKSDPDEPIEILPEEETEDTEPAISTPADTPTAEGMLVETSPPGADEPEASKEEDAKYDLTGIVWETWLGQFHSGKKRPKWADKAVEPLSTMLDSEDTEERAAAARALVPLARFDEALPMLLTTLETNPGLFDSVCSVLPWLSWDKRRETYAALRLHVSDVGSLHSLVEAGCSPPDRRIAELLWDDLADDTLGNDFVSVLQQGLMSAYSGQSYYWSEQPLSQAAARDFRETAREMLDSGNLLQRLVTLAMCSSFAADEGRPKAEAFLNDEQAGDELQVASARFLLITVPRNEAVKLAVSMLDDQREEIREASAASLTEHLTGDLGRGAWSQSAVSDISYGDSDGKPIIPLPPRGLKLDDILPVYERESNEAIRAHLGYQLTLFGDGRGLDELIRHWRKHQDDYQLQRLVYRAIASLDDASKVPILDELYKSFDSYEASDFYWTIRIMSGTEVLHLRKRIRDEVGMSRLR